MLNGKDYARFCDENSSNIWNTNVMSSVFHNLNTELLKLLPSEN